jgi:hypothetical protein
MLLRIWVPHFEHGGLSKHLYSRHVRPSERSPLGWPCQRGQAKVIEQLKKAHLRLEEGSQYKSYHFQREQ